MALRRGAFGWSVTCERCETSWEPEAGAKGRPIGEWWRCPQQCNTTARTVAREQFEAFAEAYTETSIPMPPPNPLWFDAELECGCDPIGYVSEEHEAYHRELQADLDRMYAEALAAWRSSA
ncbi:MAG: hypothetical protein CMH83_21040 [Nocardioides sp.]|nr:hypothetical protein [Nocardioides sp.]